MALNFCRKCTQPLHTITSLLTSMKK
ncbi:hypothetical protein Celaphus_00018348 [Cervus elaphus hippelaphus]|uniref:Uncharacterized protein n=1 Tax=Cervus elaphus hippelaphus TaxID=46360 RepID=A0A212C5F1_CEREH|nr:hypothetical protein Celaphus_00018348 [Cervus elaphus hippelaphus]